MAGAPLLKVEMWLGGAWVDLHAAGRVDLRAQPVSITRGRASEVATIAPGQCSFVLTNDDGLFTPENPASAYRDSLTLHRPVRVRVYDPAAASYVTRFEGYVDDDPVTLDDPTGARSSVSVVAVDRLALMSLKQLRCQRDERLMALSPVAYYPLDEASGATQANDLVGANVRLLPTQVSSGGTLEFGAEGGPIAAEGAGSVNATRSSSTAGLYLLSDGALDSLGASFSVVSIAKPSTSGYIWQLKQGAYILGLYYNASTSKYLVRQYSGSWSTLVSTSATATGMHVEVVTVSATHVVLRSDATHTPTARAAGTFTGPTLYVGYCSDSTSGYDDMPSAIFSGLAITPGVMDMTAAGTLATDLTTAATYPTDEWMQTVCDWAGVPATVGYLGAHPDLGYVMTGTQTPSGLADTIAQGANGRYAVMADGSLTWVDASYAPTIVELDAEATTAPLHWARDRSAYVTDVTTTLPSGVGSWTYSSTDAGLIRQSKSITGVLPTDQACKDVAQFIVSGSSLAPRLSQARFDLLTQDDDAVIGDVLSLDIGSQFSLSNLPPQIPDAQVLIVEGLTEAIGFDVWDVTLNTSPSSQSLPPVGWYFLWVDDAASYIDDGLGYIANL